MRYLYYYSFQTLFQIITKKLLKNHLFCVPFFIIFIMRGNLMGWFSFYEFLLFFNFFAIKSTKTWLSRNRPYRKCLKPCPLDSSRQDLSKKHQVDGSISIFAFSRNLFWIYYFMKFQLVVTFFSVEIFCPNFEFGFWAYKYVF